MVKAVNENYLQTAFLSKSRVRKVFLLGSYSVRGWVIVQTGALLQRLAAAR